MKEVQNFIYTEYHSPQDLQIYKMFCSKTRPCVVGEQMTRNKYQDWLSQTSPKDDKTGQRR